MVILGAQPIAKPVTPAELTASVIVPTFNRCSRLERLLLRLEQTWVSGARFEVAVSVDGSTDGTDAMLARLAISYPLKIVHGNHGGAGAARNLAIKAATGDVLIFLDDDVWPVDSTLIERHLEIHRRDPAAAVIGPMIPPSDIKMPAWLRWEAMTVQRQYETFASGFFAPTQLHFYTGNASVRRAHALAAGGFDERFLRQQDVEFGYRLAAEGLRFYFVPEAKVLHEPDRTLNGWLRIAYQIGRAAVLLQRKGHPYARALAYQEKHKRHPLNRLPPRWCVGHPWRRRAMVSMLTTALKYRGPGEKRIHRAVCSVVYNIQYWQGFADEMGLGTDLWPHLKAQRLALEQLA